MPNTERLPGTVIKKIWADHFDGKGEGHRYWLYTHIPFCPQICSFCQCSTSLRKSDQQVVSYLDWLEGEIDYLGEVAASGLAAYQYIGGGTPNLLTENQLERLLGKLNRSFQFTPDSRRCFEFLPSSLRPGTLEQVRSFGFNRLSCGVQAWSPETLKSVNRSQEGLEQLGRTIELANAVGYDEFNVDLIFGIGGESEEQFGEGLLQVLDRKPTTVTIHNVIPTKNNPVYSNREQELAAHARFENLQSILGDAVAKHHPNVDWVLRPNSWILVDRTFHTSSSFSLWYYSDNERIHIDMLSFGRFAHSNILGKVCYENVSQAASYDPREESYQAFLKTPIIDAAMDLITDLIGDHRSNLRPIEARYGRDTIGRLLPILTQLEEEGLLVDHSDHWETDASDGVFIDPFLPLLKVAMEGASSPWENPSGKASENAIRVGEGDRSLLVFIEKVETDKPYFRQFGNLGIFYRHATRSRPIDEPGWVDDLMNGFVTSLEEVLEETPHISAKTAVARLRHRHPNTLSYR